MQMKILCRGVGKTFIARQGALEVLRDVEIEVAEGEFCCLVGPSGCGKSTLLRILAGLAAPTRGTALIQSRLGADGPACAMVFQEHALFPWKTVLRNVAFGLQMQGMARPAREAIARRVIAKVGLERFEGYYPHQLSGGMKQRVGIARALAANPEVLLMDEPLGALDAISRNLLQGELLRIWEEERKTVLFITHSIEEAILLGDRVLLMTPQPGRIAASFEVPFPRPRSLKVKSLPQFGDIAYRIWERLQDEVVRGGEGR